MSKRSWQHLDLNESKQSKPKQPEIDLRVVPGSGDIRLGDTWISTEELWEHISDQPKGEDGP